MITSQPALTPCPFCLSDKEFVINIANCWDDKNYISCVNCGATGPKTFGKDEAVHEWNTRRIHMLDDYKKGYKDGKREIKRKLEELLKILEEK